MSKDFEILNKETKPKFVECLIIGLTALHLADSYIHEETICHYFKVDEWINEADWNNKNVFYE